MEDPNITMEEYIRLEEEKACKHAVVYNDTITFEVALSCEPMVSPLNKNEIDFRIPFDESNDEDYTVIYDKNSFSNKIISIDNLKTNSENDNDKVNMPLFPSPKPEVSYSNDLDYSKDFEKEFLAIVYNDALTSKSNFLTEPTIIPQHIDEFNLKAETSLSKCDGKEQNVLYFNDLFPLNVIYPDDLKSDTNNDNDKIDIEQTSQDMFVIPLPNFVFPDTPYGVSKPSGYSVWTCLDVISLCNGNSSYPDRRQTLEESLTKFMAELAKRHEENSNIIKEIRASTDAAIRNQGASIKTLEIQIGQMSKVLQERGIRGLLGSTEPNLRDHVNRFYPLKLDSSEDTSFGMQSIRCIEFTA
ncbi:hypothetical protein Tco_0195373 [Tanacetum coccineum]